MHRVKDGEYIDEDISGQSAGNQDLLADARKGNFDVVLCRARRRIARRAADSTNAREVLEFYEVELHSIAAGGIVTPIMAAINGIVAEQFPRDLADKTKRSQEGSTRPGRVAAGLAFGYKARPDLTPNREVDPEQAKVIVRILRTCPGSLSVCEAA